MDSISTDELVRRLQASGLPATAEKLRVDVHRGLLSPLMPSSETPGRGTPARWSPMSVCRARRIARLRKRGVNGHVLPLLLFLEDGWGWDAILPDVQAAVTKSAAVDRRHMNQLKRIQSEDDLLDKAEDIEEYYGHPHFDAIRGMRKWVHSQTWFGETKGDGSPIEFMVNTLPEMLGIPMSPEAKDEARSQAEELVAAREALTLAAPEIGPWLATIDTVTVERGRLMFWMMVRSTRWQRRRAHLPGSNPLTLGGESPQAIASYFRESQGRFTAAQMLATVIALAMFMASIAGDLPNLE